MSLAVFLRPVRTRSGGIVREREGLTGITMQRKKSRSSRIHWNPAAASLRIDKMEPICTERYDWWCERAAENDLQPDDSLQIEINHFR